MTRLIIARHGNTFVPGEVPRRIGAKTDISLVEKERSLCIGRYLREKDWKLKAAFAAPLKRTQQTAKLLISELQPPINIQKEKGFTEIDYGPDENKPEDEVITRIGEAAMESWNKKAIVPEGWILDPQQVIETWRSFADKVEEQYSGQNVLVVSSNGIIRFAPYLTGNFEHFLSHHHTIKVATGGVCVFEKESSHEYWTCTEWNTLPYQLYNQ